jgi:hypothetical protein
VGCPGTVVMTLFLLTVLFTTMARP